VVDVAMPDRLPADGTKWRVCSLHAW
jgi:hypothetical protein